MDVQSFKCPNCGANLKHQPHESIVQCSYCDSSVIVPNFLRQDVSIVSGEVSAAMPATQSSEKYEKLNELVALNRKTEAVRIYREIYDVGYTEASKAIDHMMRGEREINAGEQDIVDSAYLGKLGEVARMIAEGNKIEAIKLFREVSGSGLKEAKEAVEKMGRGESVIIRHTSMTSSQSGTSGGSFSGDAVEQAADLKEIFEYINQGKKIDAIKMYRQMFGVGLKEAKETVEKMIRGESVTIRHTSMTSSQPEISNLSIGGSSVDQAAGLQAIYELILEGKKIDAIKMYRQVFGVGLKEAKEAVEKISGQMG